MNNKIIMPILAILIASGAFFGGMQYQKLKVPSFGNFRNGQGAVAGARGMMGQRNGNGQNFRPVSGEILSFDSNGVTVKLTDGSSKIVLFSGSTAFVKSSEGTKDELKVGDKVMVVGAQNSDGSVTAQNVQINPPQRAIPTGGSGSNQ